MKARVYVSMKPSVLDPQGQAIRNALAGLGYKSVETVRQGKYFEISLGPGATAESARLELDEIAKNVLANPVIEDYEIDVID